VGLAGSFEVAVVGGGMIGAALAYGLARQGLKTVMLDEGDTAFRAARGNFGLIWVQGKGVDAPAYAEWTRASADLWPEFAAELEAITAVTLGYARPGGVELCLSQAEWDARATELARLHAQTGRRFQYEMLDRRALGAYLPDLGAAVLGGSFSPLDGHVDPLALLRALHAAFLKHGGEHRPGWRVAAVSYERPGFMLRSGEETLGAERVVLAAGLGNRALAPQLGLSAPITPVRGQILVTERLAPFLHLPTALARQSVEGTCLLGDSHEAVGLNEATTPGVMGAIARHAVASFPCLGTARVVRAWGALRIMTADGLPIYEQSETCPGALLATGHSGVTLAAGHALALAPWLAESRLPPEMAPFRSSRFDS
jgi:glycine/D-amino acid oxidase-like deaminating enzyme